MKDKNKDIPEQLEIKQLWIAASPEEPIQMISITKIGLNGKPKPKKK